MNDKSTKESMEQTVLALQKRQQANQGKQADEIRRHDELVKQYDTNDTIILLEDKISSASKSLQEFELEVKSQEKAAMDAQNFKSASSVKIRKIDQDYEFNLKKIDKARLVEKECSSDIEKKVEELRLI
jgi:hypothetical protein